jgi:hypothetical protein
MVHNIDGVAIRIVCLSDIELTCLNTFHLMSLMPILPTGIGFALLVLTSIVPAFIRTAGIRAKRWDDGAGIVDAQANTVFGLLELIHLPRLVNELIR